MSQVHSKFKVFFSNPVDRKLDPQTIKAAQDFFSARNTAIAPKSLGIEFDEETRQLVLSIGYVEEASTPHPPIQISCVSLGKLARQTAVIEAAMEEAAEKVENVICHEFYIEDGEFFIVLLSLG